MTPSGDRWPCPCCGHLVHPEPPGSFLICPVCFWEDDVQQLRWPWYSGGANRTSLVEAQRAYAAGGAKQPERASVVRPARPDEPLAPGFRPLDPATDPYERDFPEPVTWPEDKTVYYWWLAR